MNATHISALDLPVQTRPGTVWKHFWMSGIDLPHPAANQTLEDWIKGLPCDALEALHKMTAPTQLPKR